MRNIDSHNGCIWKSIAAGSVGGLAGSFAMNQFQALWSTAAKALSDQEKNDQESSGENEPATVQAAKALSKNLFDHGLTESEKKWAGPAVHYALGASLGAVYGVLFESAPMSGAGFGTVYGATVWLTADEIAVPALGLSQSPSETPISSHASALAAHLVFGLVTHLTRRMILHSK